MMKRVSAAIVLCLSYLALVLAATLITSALFAQKQPRYTAYLFTYFTGNSRSEEQIRFAISGDGYRFRALNNNEPVVSSDSISSTGGVRDPHILRGIDGKTFYMVATDMVSANGWNSNRAMVLMKSKDLIHWTSSVVNIQKAFPGNENLLRVWAPQTIYDQARRKYMIYWSMKHGKDPDKIYFAYANADFTALETAPKQLFFSPSNGACIDGDIVYRNGIYHLYFKTEGEGAGIKVAVSDSLTGGYRLIDRYVQQTADPVEGAGVFKLNGSDQYILMYDVYTRGKYQFTKTDDLEHFSVVDQQVNMDFHPRHGTVISITGEEGERLMQHWGRATSVLGTPGSPFVRKLNTRVDTAGRQVYLSLKPGAKLNAFDPLFTDLPGMRIAPGRKRNFDTRSVPYTVSFGRYRKEIWKVNAAINHNPVLDGYYADPDILYSEKTKRFYIYPTSDGFTNWSGTYFKAFSSADLVNWRDEGKILDLEKDVSWAKKNAWAPCIIEVKTGEKYRYYFYFTAAQKIGVAVSDDPAGPFVDAGKPLVDQFPPGVNRGQQIDPEVFEDPGTGKRYLYWGNGYMACAELAGDMVSLVPNTTRVITPDGTFREGTTVFFRNGTYYFLWSEDDTRSENYRVRYGMANSPTGPIRIPQNNLVIAKDAASGIFATGHNSVLQAPGKDEWYIVYHRFNYPNGIRMGKAAGYNREVCIDKMEFNSDGTIKQVTPTHTGVSR